MIRIIIDQAKITAPDFPRPLSWWCEFLPAWITRPDVATACSEWDMSTIYAETDDRVVLVPQGRQRGRAGAVLITRMLHSHGEDAVSIDGGAAS